MNMEEVAANENGQVSSAKNLVTPAYKTYKIRYFMLGTLCLLNISNAMIWLAFAPIAYTSASFYKTSLNTINMLSVVFMITGIPCGICATWIMDTFGLRWSIITSAWLNCVGAVLRTLSAVDGISEDARLPLVFTGQILAACAQPFMLFAPTKLSALWFPDDQRAIANTLASMSNPLGIMLASITSPLLAPNTDTMLFMLAIQAIPAGLAAIMATLGVCRNEPRTPPSSSAEAGSMPFWEGIKALFRNKYYLLLTWAVGGGIALFSVLITLLSQILCPWGYDDNFAGVVCGGAMIGAGFVGAAIAGVIVDKTKRFIEVIKICFSLAVIATIFFAVVQNHPNMGAAIAVSCGLFGLFGLPVYPIGNELGVETTYPVGEATSSGILFMFGQIIGIILIVVLESIGREMTPEEAIYSKCKTNGTTGEEHTAVIDMSVPSYVFAGFAVITAVVFVLAFRTDYHRLRAENSSTINDDGEIADQKPVIESSSSDSGNENSAYSSGKQIHI